MGHNPSNETERLAVVIFNLGGPDSPEAVKPFLFNLFSDPAILRLPNPWRWIIARLIAWRRAPTSKKIYELVGGRSSILPATEEQARALEAEIADAAQHVEVFVFMRYWAPMVSETVSKIKKFHPDRVLLLPLYPQFSTTTTGTSMKAFREEAKRQGLDVPQDSLCCYPRHNGFLDPTVANINEALDNAAEHGPPRLLLSAHGLPQRTVDAGDPYKWQIEQTSAAIIEALNRPGLDWVTCYQSRVGPVKWIEPYSEDEIRRAGQDGLPVVIAPIAFVSEHVETEVEIDIEFREIADKAGVPFFVRCPAVATDCKFISGLADLVRQSIGQGDAVSDIRNRRCPMAYKYCPNSLGA